MKIIEFIHDHGSVKTSNLVEMFHISRQAALKELTSMVEKNLLEKDGIRKAARYILK